MMGCKMSAGTIGLRFVSFSFTLMSYRREIGTFTFMFACSFNNERLLFCFTHYFLFNPLTNSSLQ